MLFRPLPEAYSVPHGVHTDWLTDAGGTCRIHVTATCGAGLRVGLGVVIHQLVTLGNGATIEASRS